MKIDESCINHNVDRLIGLIVDNAYECMDDSREMDKTRCTMLGEIRGIHILAEELKAVLNT